MRIDEYIANHAKTIPKNIALEEKERSVSYSLLDENISTIASEINDFENCKFAILAESGIEYIQALMAVYRSDNIAVPLPVELMESNIREILDSNRINNIIVTDQQYSRFGNAFFEGFATVINISNDSSVMTLRKKTITENNNELLRLVMYTSGTTGTPKGVMLSDENLIANANSIIDVLNITPKDKAAQVISPHHAFGNSINKEATPIILHPLCLWDYNEEKIVENLIDIGWIPPKISDSNSTNCLLNAFACDNHIKKYEIHPYAFDIAGLVRSGDMTREEGLDKLHKELSKPLIEMAAKKLNMEIV